MRRWSRIARDESALSAGTTYGLVRGRPRRRGAGPTASRSCRRTPLPTNGCASWPVSAAGADLWQSTCGSTMPRTCWSDVMPTGHGTPRPPSPRQRRCGGSRHWRTLADGRCSSPGRSGRVRCTGFAPRRRSRAGGTYRTRTACALAPVSDAVRGGYGARRLRERLPHPLDGPPPPVKVLLARVAAGDPGDPAALREALHWFGMRRRGPLAQLSRLATHPDPGVREGLV